MKLSRIIISRTDSLGDVVLTLPLAGVIRDAFPESRIIFLGRSYTKDLIRCSAHVDEFADWDHFAGLKGPERVEAFKALRADAILHVFPRAEIAKLAGKAGIKTRIGTTNRLYHWGTCTHIFFLSRKNSDLHEAQLNLKLLQGLGIHKSWDLPEICPLYGLNPPGAPDPATDALTDPEKFNLVLHPKSKGSAREWGADNFSRLIAILPREKFRIFITGTREEGLALKGSLLDRHPEVTDLTGKFTLAQLIRFISLADGMVAASTGPLHIAAALGRHAIGLYPPIRPMHPGRWAPVGPHAGYLVLQKVCSECRRQDRCHCIESITPEMVRDRLMAAASLMGK